MTIMDVSVSILCVEVPAAPDDTIQFPKMTANSCLIHSTFSEKPNKCDKDLNNLCLPHAYSTQKHRFFIQ